MGVLCASMIFYVWSLFYLFFITLSFEAPGRLFFVIMAFPVYLHLHFVKLLGQILSRVLVSK